MTMSPAARALLDAAREGLTPSPEALHRVRGKVGAAAAAGASSALAIKLAIVSIIAVAVGALALTSRGDSVVAPVLALSNSTGAHDVAAQVEPQRSFEPPPPPVAHIEMPAQRFAAPNAATSNATTSNATSPSPRAGSVPRPDTRAGSVPVAGRRGIDLAREVELVDAAMAALRKGDATAALASVRMHRAETADRGQLAEDAAAIEIEALCRLRDRRVAAKLEAFDARWPESAQRSRLSTNCP